MKKIYEGKTKDVYELENMKDDMVDSVWDRYLQFKDLM